MIKIMLNIGYLIVGKYDFVFVELEFKIIKVLVYFLLLLRILKF